MTASSIPEAPGRLAFVLFKYFPHGGLQRDMMRVAEACRSRGADITVFAMEWRGPLPEGIETRVYPGKGFTRMARMKDFADFVRDSTGNGFQAVVGFNRMPGLDFYFAADSCFAAKAYGRRGMLYRMTPRCRLYLEYESAVFAPGRDVRIFLLSPLQKRQYLAYYETEEERCFMLPPGIGRDRCYDEYDAPLLRWQCRQEFGLDRRERMLLQIGSGFSVKGVDRSIRALASLPRDILADTRLVVVGEGRQLAYTKLAKKLGVAENIVFLPPRNDIPRLLQGADLLIHPARSESAGYVLLEAIVAGLPVLTTDTCGYAFHVRAADAGRVCESPFRQGRLNELLLEMLEATNERDTWRDNGIHYGRREALYDMPERAAELICTGGVEREIMCAYDL